MSSESDALVRLSELARELELNPGSASTMAGIRDVFVQVYYPLSPMELEVSERESLTSSIARDLAELAARLAGEWDLMSQEQAGQAATALEEAWRELIALNHYLVSEWAVEFVPRAREELLALAARHSALSGGEFSPAQLLGVMCEAFQDPESDLLHGTVHMLYGKGIAALYGSFAASALHEDLVAGVPIDFPRVVSVQPRSRGEGLGRGPFD